MDHVKESLRDAIDFVNTDKPISVLSRKLMLQSLWEAYALLEGHAPQDAKLLAISFTDAQVTERRQDHRLSALLDQVGDEPNCPLLEGGFP